MRGASRTLKATWVALALAVVLMIVFDATLTRIVGVTAIFAFIALGTFAIATPEFLEGDRDDSEVEPER
ncbi:hypothetical protein HJD18_09950 [Thermoleophilia bacterium SCSIO 60948]|nr:hypothetical protein HJD18_09950 [Thermoleophilia bacterium SCSIO 60948]